MAALLKSSYRIHALWAYQKCQRYLTQEVLISCGHLPRSGRHFPSSPTRTVISFPCFPWSSLDAIRDSFWCERGHGQHQGSQRRMNDGRGTLTIAGLCFCPIKGLIQDLRVDRRLPAAWPRQAGHPHLSSWPDHLAGERVWGDDLHPGAWRGAGHKELLAASGGTLQEAGNWRVVAGRFLSTRI